MPEEPFIPVARPWLGDAEAEAARRPILAGWVTQGAEVAAFEREFAEAVGAPHACAVSSGTTALHLALHAAGCGPGDEVVTASHSFVASSNAIRHCGAKPVFVDVDLATFNMDPALVEAALSERTRAILAIHQIGMPCDLQAILRIADRRGIPVVEDAACAIGSEIRRGGAWERIGRPHGDAACFSFHPRKLVTTGDGGMITTRRADWDERFRLLRQHAMSVPDTVRHGSREVIFESYTELGYNYRMTDIQAAVGREQLRRLPEMVARRREQAERYAALLGGVPGLVLPREPAWARANWQSYCVRLPERCDQRAVMQSMLDAGIATRRGVMCAHREPAYPPGTWRCAGGSDACDCGPGSCRRLARSEEAQDRGLILPLYHTLTERDQERVAENLKRALEKTG